MNSSAVKKMFKKAVYSSKNSIKDIRHEYDSIFYETTLPNAVDLQEDNAKNITIDILTPTVAGADKCILYIHGGWFISGSKKAYRSFCASIANETETVVVLPEYRLAPENPFPAGLEDIYTTYDYICSTKKISSKNIILAGDGSGAGLALSLVHYLNSKQLPMPGGLALISPWADLVYDGEKQKKLKKKDLFLNIKSLNEIAKMYAGENKKESPLISPIRGNFKNFPPVFIQTGTDELLYNQSEELAEKLNNNGVPNKFDAWDKMWHFFQAMPDYAPNAHIAVENIANEIIKMFENTFTE